MGSHTTWALIGSGTYCKDKTTTNGGRGRLLETGRLLDEGGAKSNHNGNRKERILNGQ